MGGTIQSDGFVHFLACTDAASSAVASQINTDYVELVMEFKQDNTASLYFTGESVELEALTDNYAPAYLVECDLNGLATSYGWDNATLKSKLSSIAVNAYAEAHGASGGVLTYGVKTFVSTVNNSFAPVTTTNMSYIDLITAIWGNNDDASFVTTTNSKFYYMVCSQYSSGSGIISSLSLDYIDVEVTLSRSPDVVAPIPIVLPSEWSLVVQGFSPCWDSTKVIENHPIAFNLYMDTNNRFDIWFHSGLKSFCFTERINSVAVNALLPTYEVFNKNQVFNLICSKSLDKITIFALKNNDIVQVTTASTTATKNGLYDLYLLKDQINAFASRFALIPRAITDSEAEAILKTTAPGYEAPNLIPDFNSDRWTLHANAVPSSDGKTLTLNANGSGQYSYITIPVLPNNQYEFTFNQTGGGWAWFTEQYNDFVVKSVAASQTFITKADTNNIVIAVSNDTSGTFTFSDLDLHIKMIKEG
jgi:hypothetical protein